MTMTESTLRLEPLPALRLAGVSGEVGDTSEIKAMVAVLSETLAARLATVGASSAGRVCTFEGRPDGWRIDVVVGVPLAPGDEPPAGLDVLNVPPAKRAAVAEQHRMGDEAIDPWLTIDTALARCDLESYGPYRLVHLPNTDDGDDVVHLQCPVRDAAPCHYGT